jgi:Spy/CpxP family protein refolding chaperone
MKTLKTLTLAALVATLLLPASVLMAQPPGGPGEGRGRGFGGDEEFPFREFLFERMAEKLELSDGQKAEIEAIRDGHRNDIEPLREKARAARHAVGDLMRADAFDEATVRTAAREAADIEVELMVIRARHRSELKSVLTPEQQEKAAELRQQWQEKADQFRGRGRGVDRGPGRGFDRGAGPGRGPGRW